MCMTMIELEQFAGACGCYNIAIKPYHREIGKKVCFEFICREKTQAVRLEEHLVFFEEFEDFEFVIEENSLFAIRNQ